VAVLALTTVARLRVFGGITGTAPDTDLVLADMIDYVSQKLEQYCSRPFLQVARVESRVLQGQIFPTLGYPVISVSSVMVAESGRARDLRAWTDFEITPGGNSISVWDIARGSLVQASFVGGVSPDTADVIANHQVLEGACKLQTLNLWQRHKSPDKTGLTIVSGDTRWEGQYEMLKDVKRDLDNNYRASQRFV
jgi:hypothetical protein